MIVLLCVNELSVNMSSVPTLVALCCQAVDRLLIINLDNALDVLQYGRTHDLPTLADRATAFIRSSFVGLCARHPAADLEAVLGLKEYLAMSKEATEIGEGVSRLRLLGTVVDTPSKPTAGRDETTPRRQPSASTPRRGWQAPAATASEKCAKCGKTVYAAERLSPVSGLVWHATCFRCDDCACKLTVNSFEIGSDFNVPLCKPHFAQRRSAAGGLGLGGHPSPRGGADVAGSAEGAPSSLQGAPKGLSGAGDSAHETACRVIEEHRRAWGGNHCFRCSRAVYAVERQLARTHRGDDMVFHKACFRCLVRMCPKMMMICLPPQGTPPTHTAADMAHSTHSTQPALRPHRTTPRAEDKPPQTRRPHSNGLCPPLSEGPDPGSAQRYVNAGSPVQTGIYGSSTNC